MGGSHHPFNTSRRRSHPVCLMIILILSSTWKGAKSPISTLMLSLCTVAITIKIYKHLGFSWPSYKVPSLMVFYVRTCINSLMHGYVCTFTFMERCMKRVKNSNGRGYHLPLSIECESGLAILVSPKVMLCTLSCSSFNYRVK